MHRFWDAVISSQYKVLLTLPLNGNNLIYNNLTYTTRLINSETPKQIPCHGFCELYRNSPATKQLKFHEHLYNRIFTKKHSRSWQGLNLRHPKNPYSTIPYSEIWQMTFRLAPKRKNNRTTTTYYVCMKNIKWTCALKSILLILT